MNDSKGLRTTMTATLLGLVLGIVLGFVMDEENATPAQDSPVTESEEPRAGDGDIRNETGAVAAATQFTLLSASDSSLDIPTLKSQIRSMATESFQEEAVEQAAAGHTYIVDTYGPEPLVNSAPLGYDLVEFSPDAATIRLWTVSVAAGPKRANAEEVWATVTVNVSWESSAWRVAGFESSVGPAPVDLPSDQSSLSATSVMKEFDEYHGAPTP